MNRKKVGLVSGFVVAAVVIGGGLSSLVAIIQNNNPTHLNTVNTVGQNAQSSSAPPPRLISLANRERTLPPAPAKQYNAIPVITSSGKHETVSVQDQPVVFVSEMDPTILQQFAGQKFKKEPILIATWPLPKQSLGQDLQSVEKEVKRLRLHMQVVELGTTKTTAWITGIPDTYIGIKGQVKEVPGILPPNEIKSWTNVFN